MERQSESYPKSLKGEFMSANGSSYTQDQFTIFNLKYIPSPDFFHLLAELDGGLMYLASPYSSKGAVEASVRRRRLVKTIEFTHRLLDSGCWVFSPIVYGSGIEANGFMHDNKWWLRRDFEFFKRCDALGVYCLKGWEKSPGVNKEIDWALVTNKKVLMLNEESEDRQ